MIVYRGFRSASGRPVVSTDDGQLLFSDGAPFDWGAASPGAFALARALLTMHLGALPSRGVAHRFAFLTVATWTKDRWLLTSNEMDDALSQVRAMLRLTCPLCGDTGRREVVSGLWRPCECRPA